jgi:ketosteroid isomerase-like protein
MQDVVARYFEMWNTGDVSIAREVLSPRWVDHAHPDVDSVEKVEAAVRAIRAARPGLTFHVDAVLGHDGDLVAVVGRVGLNRLVWLVRVEDGLMAEMWTYTTNAPASVDE